MIKFNCVNDKLTQLNGHMVVTDQSMSSLTLEHRARATTRARQHEFTRITILYQKVVMLGTEAEQCIGEDVELRRRRRASTSRSIPAFRRRTRRSRIFRCRT